MRVLAVLKTNLINRIKLSEITGETNQKGKRIFVYISSVVLCACIICAVYFQIRIFVDYTEYGIYFPQIIKGALAIFFILNSFYSVKYVLYSETNLLRLIPMPLTAGQVMFVKSLESILLNGFMAFLFVIPVSLSMHFTSNEIIIFLIYCVAGLTFSAYNIANAIFLLLFSKRTISESSKVIEMISLLGNIIFIVSMMMHSNKSGLILGSGILFSVVCYWSSIVNAENSYLLIVERNRKKEKMYETKTGNLSVQKALFLKELKVYLSDKFYMVNSSFGALMLIVFSIILTVVPFDSLIQDKSFPVSYLYLSIPVIFAIIISTCCITYCTFSLEGKNLWILQKSPVTIGQIVKAKVSVNLGVSVPCILISVLIIFLFGRAHMNLFRIAMCLVLPVLCSLYISLFGCLIDLQLCDLNWENAQMLIKRSKTYPITLLAGMLPCAVCEGCVILLVPRFGEALVYGTVCAIFAVVIVILWQSVKGKQRRFHEIGRN